MSDERSINGKAVKLTMNDITMLDIDCFVFYAQSDLKLGSGFGGAITVRGGPEIQKELDTMGPIEVGQAVVSEAGNLKASYIIHANGPKFQEEDIKGKLRTTVLNALKAAESKGVKKVALPPMGTGFYGVPLELSAQVTFDAIGEYLRGDTPLEEVVLCVQDNREYKPFAAKLETLA